jgi:hypothetical protein
MNQSFLNLIKNKINLIRNIEEVIRLFEIVKANLDDIDNDFIDHLNFESSMVISYLEKYIKNKK